MELYPVGITQTDWEIFNKFVKDNLGYSPTRGLSESGIKKHAAWAACLDLENNPLECLKRGYWKKGIFQHVNISLMGKIPDYFVGPLSETDLKINYWEVNKREILVLLTGSLMTMIETVNNFAGSDDKDQEVRELGTKMYEILSFLGFKTCFTHKRDYQNNLLKIDV